jgi:protocatechuate 3,4-dioxygenase beta subunit
MNKQMQRRQILQLVGAAVLPACARSGERRMDAGPPVQSGGYPSVTQRNVDAAQAVELPKSCKLTEANIEGPYYRDGAQFRSNLIEPGIVGRELTLEGRVLSMDCRSALAGASLDIWQADTEGRYDNDGTFDGKSMRLRGKVRVDEQGRFSVRTIVPGRYLNGKVYRPAHIHVKLSASGHAPLTTQLYFPDDPYNKVDPFIHRSLIMDVSGNAAHYDFVLRPV